MTEIQRLQWRTGRLSEFSVEAVYAMLAARSEVFVVEQECAYLDLDGLDHQALHVAAFAADASLRAYARILPPQTRFAELSIGRVLVVRAARGTGLGRELVRRSIAAARLEYPPGPIRISAQLHLAAFYGDFGFVAQGQPYAEDGIPHVDMLLSGPKQ